MPAQSIVSLVGHQALLWYLLLSLENIYCTLGHTAPPYALTEKLGQ